MIQYRQKQEARMMTKKKKALSALLLLAIGLLTLKTGFLFSFDPAQKEALLSLRLTEMLFLWGSFLILCYHIILGNYPQKR